MAAVSPARQAAFHILIAAERGQSHSDDLLRGQAVSALSPADRKLATALVLGVLRWQIRLDHQLHSLLKRPNARLDDAVLIALRLGAFQLLHLDRIPARAAIDESVEVVRSAGNRFASGMVNAVLRKLAAAPLVHFSEVTVANLALAQAHPTWMVERWAEFYGMETARAICHHGQAQPVQSVRLAHPEVESELDDAGIRLEPGGLLTAARRVVRGDLTSTPAFREGRARLQDEGSQLVAELACANSGPKAKTILDACAAPGGKTVILAERNPQARIVACETSSPRLEELRKRLAPQSERIECRLADATALIEDSVFDLALADVPCSGTGTLGRNPEIRHRLHPGDLPRQSERQRAILKAALRAVRPGGRVVCSTCSLEPEENEEAVAHVLAETPRARALSLQPRIEALRDECILTPSGAERLHQCLTPEGALRLLPGRFHTDGFFVALIERTA